MLKEYKMQNNLKFLKLIKLYLFYLFHFITLLLTYELLYFTYLLFIYIKMSSEQERPVLIKGLRANMIK